MHMATMQRAIPLVAALLAGALGLLSFTHNIELQTCDLRVAATARPSVPARDVVLIQIDNVSIRRMDDSRDKRGRWSTERRYETLAGPERRLPAGPGARDARPRPRVGAHAVRTGGWSTGPVVRRRAAGTSVGNPRCRRIRTGHVPRPLWHADEVAGHHFERKRRPAIRVDVEQPAAFDDEPHFVFAVPMLATEAPVIPSDLSRLWLQRGDQRSIAFESRRQPELGLSMNTETLDEPFGNTPSCRHQSYSIHVPPEPRR